MLPSIMQNLSSNLHDIMMIRILILVFGLIALPHAFAQGTDAPHKAIVNIITYKGAQNQPVSGYGFFIARNGVGIASYNLFRDATKADVIDAKGNKFHVTRILGASSQYDLVKFQINSNNTSDYLPPASTPANLGANLHLYTYTAAKKTFPTNIHIEKVIPYTKYKYYETSAANIEKHFGCPLLNDQNEAIAIVQRTLAKDAKNASAIDARFVTELSITSTGSINSDLRKIRIPKALPDSMTAALAYIYMMNQDNPEEAIAAHNDFIEAYPDNAEGYVNRGTYYGRNKDYTHCEADFTTALLKSSQPQSTLQADEVHHAYAKLMMEQLSNDEPTSGCPWSWQTALEKERMAYQANPNPIYLMQIGNCHYNLKEYAQAYETFTQVNKTSFATPDTYIAAAQALEQMDADKWKVLEQLDSALTHVTKPYTLQTAPLLYAHSIQAIKCEQFRQAALDLFEYEKILTPNRLTDQFYYERAQTERKAKMYQQALDDIRTAQARSTKPQYYLYLLEESSLLLQVGMYDEAIATSRAVLNDLPENPDAYKIIGIAYGEKGEKKLAKENLERAQTLGDPNIEPLLNKYR